MCMQYGANNVGLLGLVNEFRFRFFKFFQQLPHKLLLTFGWVNNLLTITHAAMEIQSRKLKRSNNKFNVKTF